MSNSPWTNFSVGTPSTKKNWVEPDCSPFSEITHVTHIAQSLNIIREGVMRPQLVYDESILNTRRILVNWASPNYWSPGFRYGNVSFKLDWQTLIENKRYYWVEVMDYNPSACRILVTDIDYDSDPQLTQYDPSDGDGPWWWNQSDGIHYRNGEICLEIMLECELPTNSCKGISFVKHHDNYCCIDAASCQDKGLDLQEAGAIFIAGVLSQDLDVTNPSVEQFYAQGGRGWLLWNLPQKGYVGGVDRNAQEAEALARSIATAYYHRRKNEFVNLARIFSGKDEARAALDTLILEKMPNANDDF